MSMTMSLASSSARRNVASTTNVAPCRRCAGPNTSPRRLWAIIMCSRTVTLNMPSPVIRNRVTKRSQATFGQTRHDTGQLVEARLAGDERVEGPVAQQVECECESVGGRATRTPGRRHRPDLTGAQPEPTRVERTAQRESHLGVAVPAEIEHGALGCEQIQGQS